MLQDGLAQLLTFYLHTREIGVSRRNPPVNL
jgi:hypothetical protein